MSENIGFVEGTAGRLRVSDGGVGEPAVLLVHGLGNDLDAWRESLDHLRRHRRAVAYDQRGHGGSDRPRDGVYTVEALAADVAAVADALRLERFVLVGHSLSGTVLSCYAGAHPDRVAGLVYVDALGDLHGVPRPAIEEELRAESSPGFGAAEVRAAFAEMLGPAAKPATRERVLAAVGRMEPRAYVALRRSGFYFEVGDRLAAYRGPILAIEAGGEPNPARASVVIGRAKRVDIDGVSHWLQLDDPDAFNRALDVFLGLPSR